MKAIELYFLVELSIVPYNVVQRGWNPEVRPFKLIFLSSTSQCCCFFDSSSPIEINFSNLYLNILREWHTALRSFIVILVVQRAQDFKRKWKWKCQKNKQTNKTKQNKNSQQKFTVTYICDFYIDFCSRFFSFVCQFISHFRFELSTYTWQKARNDIASQLIG